MCSILYPYNSNTHINRDTDLNSAFLCFQKIRTYFAPRDTLVLHKTVHLRDLAAYLYPYFQGI